MSVRILRRLGLVFLAICIFSGSHCGSNPPAPVLQTPQVEANITLPTACSGNSAPPASMGSNAQTLANYIGTYFFADNVSAPNNINIGVAQWHANDMAEHGQVSLVGSDGEDALMRLTCSGAAATSSFAGVIAVGVSDDAHAVFEALQNDINAQFLFQEFSANAVANGTTTSISVGYDNGYWMIILQ